MIAALLARLTPCRVPFMVGAGIAAGVLAFGAGWVVNGWRLGNELSRLKATQAQERATQATGALSTLQADAAAIHKAATEYAAVRSSVRRQLSTIENRLTEDAKKKPLPAGCAPDDSRVNALKSAVSAAQSAIDQ
jgi:hypothetical protein